MPPFFMFEDIVISEQFFEFLDKVSDRCISDVEWEFPYNLVKDPAWETSIALLKKMKASGIRYDVPPTSLVRSAAWTHNNIDVLKLNITKKLLKSQFPNCLDNPVIGYYPPNGFVGWHTNYGAPGWIILFNWSQEGRGYFRFYKDGNLTTLSDKPGWNCRVGRFRPEPEHELWHCAKTECRRFSFSYRFDNEHDWQKAVDCITGV